MIINYSGQPVKNNFEFSNIDLPYGNYTLTVLNIQGLINSPPKFDDFYEISCNLIAREDGNPHKVIGYFFLEGGSSFVEYTPTQKFSYKLHVLNFSSTELKIRGVRTDQYLNFDFATTQLEVIDSYGRL